MFPSQNKVELTLFNEINPFVKSKIITMTVIDLYMWQYRYCSSFTTRYETIMFRNRRNCAISSTSEQ